MKKLAIILALCMTVPLAAWSQVVRPTWRADLPGGNYSVALESIASVSTHEYVLEGKVKVFELTIATNSAVTARFYYIEAFKVNAPGGIGQSAVNTVQEKVQEGMERVTGETGNPLLTGVVKNYPATTHAHTVEYRLNSRDSVTKLFKSVETAWRNNTDATAKP